MDPSITDDDVQISLRRGYTGQNTGGDYQQGTIKPAVTITPFMDSTAHAKPPPKKSTLREKLAGLWINPPWNTIFVFACVIAVSLDPLFFYIPIIDEPKKCLHMDGKLMKVAVVLRSLMDITLLVHIVCQIRQAISAVKRDLELELDANEQIIGKLSRVDKFFDALEYVDTIWEKLEWRSFMTDIFAILPIPQVLLVVVFFRMRGPGYLNYRKLLNFFLLIQYVARIYRIFLSSKMLTETAGIWVKGVFNFFLYILASHVFGGFWYFFSIQRQTSCWHRTCAANGKCESTFYCGTNHTESLMKDLNENCAPRSDFGYGIFKAALESHNTETKKFIEKLFYCFWWGMRNLSNFGTNLSETSNYPWENLFAILVSISGLLIFLYLIGNVQTYMQMQTTKSEEIRQKINLIEQEIKPWMTRKGLPETLRTAIIADIKQALGKNKDTNMEDLFSVFSWNTQKNLKRFLCMPLISKVPKLGDMDERVRKMICDYLKPVKYLEDHSFIRVGEPVERMIFITEGTLYITTGGGSDSSHAGEESKTPSSSVKGVLKKGEFYGHEQLLSWAAPGKDPSLEKLPNSTENVKSHTKVEGFTLSAGDLERTVRKCRHLWKYSHSV